MLKTENGKKLEFRLLNADEIDCRIAMVKESGVSILLYKDARVDQNILDEVVGPMNWSRTHQLIGDRLYCTVSIRDSETGEWVSKQDVGTESYTEKEKGQASDSFKRACFNWGIGRELYTAPFIWIPSSVCKISKGQNGRFSCLENFSVCDIGYDDNRRINLLKIVNGNGKIMYSMGDKPKEESNPKMAKLEAKHINELYMQLQRTGVGLSGLLKEYHVNDIHDLTIMDYEKAIDRLRSRPDKPIDPNTIPPEDSDDPTLPWNNPQR